MFLLKILDIHMKINISIYSFKWLHYILCAAMPWSIQWFSLHHLLFGGQVYHSLLFLDLFKFSFQSMELTALVVAATDVAIYWLCLIYSACLCLFAFALHALLHAAEPCLLTGLLQPSLALPALHPLCWALCPDVHCAVGCADHAPFP